MNDLPLAILFGLAIGFALGAFGGGGSILAVPALVYGLGMSVDQAIPTSLLVVSLTAAVAAWAHRRAGTLDVRTAAVFGGAGIAGSLAGTWLHHLVPDGLVLGGLAVVMVVAAVGMWRRGTRDEDLAPGAGSAGTSTTSVRARLGGRRMAAVLGAGAGVGVLTGLFGVGGGFLIVPALVLVLDLPMGIAVGTSLAVIAVTAAAGLAAHLGYGGVDVAVASAFALGGMAGAFTGQCTASRLSSGGLARGFAVLVAVIGVSMLVGVLTT